MAMGMLCIAIKASGKCEDYKPRLVVMTDIGDCNVEPDDMESAIHLLACADLFEIEAIMTTVGWNCDPYPEEWAVYLDKVVDAYSIDVMNLKKRSGQEVFMPLEKENGRQQIGYWPSAEYIRSRAMAGSHRGGIHSIGKDNDSEGSEMLIKLADEDDDRPIYVAAWGGANTLAQAIWKIRETRGADAMKTFLRKFRVYTISDQDMDYNNRMNRAYSSHQWMRKEMMDDLLFIWDEGTWQTQCDLGKEHWNAIESAIMGKGAMGRIYPRYKWGVEGDTPSFLYCIPNGLADPEDPSQAGWAGCHEWGMCPDSITYTWTSWQQPMNAMSIGFKRLLYTDELNDFCARMQWAETGKGNRNPVVRINGKHSVKPLVINAKAGKTLKLDASKSYDPDGDELAFKWWQQPIINGYTKALVFDNNTSGKQCINIPIDAKGQTIHIICEVHDKGPFTLPAYMRVIVKVEG